MTEIMMLPQCLSETKITVSAWSER